MTQPGPSLDPVRPLPLPSWRGRNPHRYGLLTALLILLSAVIWSCGPATDPATERGLTPLDAGDLTAVDEAQRTAIEEQRATLDRLLDDEASTSASLAAAYGDLAVHYGTAGSWEAARICYANAAVLEAGEIRWILGEAMMRGGAAIAGGAWEAADDAYRTVLENDPHNLAAYRGLAIARREMGDLAGAYEVTRAGLAVGPPEGSDFSAPQLAERSSLLVQLGDLEFTRAADDAGIAALTAALELDPSRVALRPRIADALARLGRLEGALGQYESYLDLHPDDLEVRERYATALVNLGEGDRAVAEFQRAIEESGDLTLEMRYAAALEYLGRVEAAEEVRESIRNRATTSEARAQLALLDGDRALRQRELTDAEAHYRQALVEDPGSSSARMRLARALGQQGRWDEAAQELESVLAGDPRNPEAQRAQIMVLILGKRYPRAREQLQTALKEYPRDVELALTQIRLLASVPDPDVADGNLALAIAQRVYENQKDESSLEALALALAATGNFEKAIEAQEALIAATQQSELARLDQARLETYQRQESWIARVPEEFLVDLGV